MGLIEEQSGLLYVRTAYREDWVERARQLHGRWDPQARAWTFPVSRRADVEHAVDDVFGTVDGGEDPSGENFASCCPGWEHLSPSDGMDGELDYWEWP